MLKYWK